MEREYRTYKERLAQAQAEQELVVHLAAVAREAMFDVLTCVFNMEPERARQRVNDKSFEVLLEGVPLQGIGHDRLYTLAQTMGVEAAQSDGQTEAIEDLPNIC